MLRHIVNFTKQQLGRNYYSERAYRHFALFLLNLLTRREGREIWLVYQMGKVGSSSIQESLKKLKQDRELNVSVYHVHSLTRDGLYRRENYHKRNFSHEPYINYHLLHCEYLGGQLARGLKGKRWKVVTLVRDPIARNISGFFHELSLTGNYGYPCNLESVKFDDLVEKRQPLFLKHSVNTRYP